jgi:uracil-DNA glycosylase
MPNPQETVDAMLPRLRAAHPDAKYELNWETPLQLLVATILAAQCTDERVNRVTPALFAKYKTAEDFAGAGPELEELIRPTGYYNNKAKSIRGTCKGLAGRFGGEVPRTVEELTTLPGIARKTANVVLNTAFKLPSGVIVDTHVARVSGRMGLSKKTDPDDIEQDLMRLVPKDEWTFFGPAVVLHGRYTCKASSPNCGACPLENLCPKIGVDGASVAAATVSAASAADESDEPPPKPKAAKPAKAAKPSAKSKAATAAAGPSAGGEDIPEAWRPHLVGELSQPYWAELQKFVADERAKGQVFPPEGEVFTALRLTPPERVSVVLLGQDPYHDDGQAHGLSFSVKPGIKPPPSLANIYKELSTDLGCRIPKTGCLTKWAEQGVLLLNAVLTVRAHEPNSHKDRGWERFTDAVIRAVNDGPLPVVFLLWGAYAQKKAKLINEGRHTVIRSAHPSPLSAAKWFGGKPFSQANAALRALGRPEIDWQIED